MFSTEQFPCKTTYWRGSGTPSMAVAWSMQAAGGGGSMNQQFSSLVKNKDTQKDGGIKSLSMSLGLDVCGCTGFGGCTQWHNHK